MLNVLELAEQDTRLHKASVRELAGPCPNPDCHCRTDGFRVQSGKNEREGEAMPRGGFMCRGCWDPARPPLRPDRPRWGDPIDYLMHVRKMSFKQARALLDEQNGTVTHSAPIWDESRIHSRPVANDWRSPQWQEIVHKAVEAAQARLWLPQHTLALDFARRRGLSDEIIRKSRLGYGLQDGIPRLVIPSNNGGQYVAIYRRDLRPDVPKERRWRDVPGGTKSELYLADCLLKRTYPTIVTEAALDALSLVQECGDIVNVVATGGVNCGKLEKWLELLKRMPCVLIAFDRDAAGEQEAKWWLKRLPNAQRLLPHGHDINAMLMQGWDLRDWVTHALQPDPTIITAQEHVQTTQMQEELSSAEPGRAHISTCWSCNRPSSDKDRKFSSTLTGLCYCQYHPPSPRMQPQLLAQPAPSAATSGPEPVAEPVPLFAMPAAQSEQPITVAINSTSQERVMPPKIVQRAQEIYSTEIATVEADDDGLATRCWSCLTSMEADDREFYYSETGVCHCQYHVPPPEMQAAASEFLGNATRRLQECFGPCTITIDPPGYTLANRVRDLKRERAKPL